LSRGFLFRRERQEACGARSFDGFGKIPLVFSTEAGFPSRFDFHRKRKKLPEHFGVVPAEAPVMLSAKIALRHREKPLV